MGPRLRRHIALAYAKERRTFGRAIVQYQYIQRIPTGMALSTEFGRAPVTDGSLQRLLQQSNAVESCRRHADTAQHLPHQHCRIEDTHGYPRRPRHQPCDIEQR